MVKSRKQRATEDADETEAPVSTSDLLKILSGIAQTLSAQSLASQSAQPSSSHHVNRSLQLPKLPAPDELTIPSFRDWKQRWVDYSHSQQLIKLTVETQHGILRSALHKEWTMLWTSQRIPIQDSTSAEDILQLLEDYLRRKRNPLLDRQAFHRRDQQQGESVDRYFAALKSLDDACSFEDDIRCTTCYGECDTVCSDLNCAQPLTLTKNLQEVRIRDRLICGLRDKEMQRKVLAEQYSSILTLERVLSICVAVENSYTTGATLSATPASPPQDVNAASKPKSSFKKKKQQPPNKKWDPDQPCSGCGKTPRHKRAECPAAEVTCHSCKRQGHYSKVCRSKKEDQEKNTPPTAGNPRGNNTVVNAGAQKLLQLETVVQGTTCFINWLPDTGSQMDAISHSDFLKLGTPVTSALTPVKVDVVAANNQSLGPIGSFPATIKLNERSYSTTVGVYKFVTKPLLSEDGCKALGLVPYDWPYHHPPAPSESHAISEGRVSYQKPAPVPPSTIAATKEALLLQHADAFDDTTLRPMNGEPMSIKLVEGAQPCKRYRAYNIPFHWRDKVKEGLDSMISKDIIEPVPVGEAIDWCHPMVVVPKKASSEPRITVDLTGLNKFVRRPAYPTKVPREVVARIPPGMKYFTTLDARHGYWQVPLDEESKKLTTFITPWGCFRFKRNVMGLISAGDEHNRRGDEALTGIPNVEKVVEDILIYDMDLQAHIKRVSEVISRCNEHRITLNKNKFVFAQPEVEWCGYRITRKGYTPAAHLYSALADFPVPINKTDVRSFCGLVQQFEAFSHKITELASPIRSLLSAKAAFVWEQPHQKAFEAIIKELCSPRLLAQFHPDRPLRLETDAAQSKGLGFALYQQQDDGIWKILQVGSRFVTPTEARYSASEIEMLAVVWAIKKCRLYLLGQPFELIVDHRPLVPIINSKTLDEIENTRLQRFKEKLSSYRVHAIWRAGAKHTVVDVFSRHPSTDPDDEDIAMGLDEDPTPFLSAALHDPDDGQKIISDPLLTGIQDAAALSSEYRRLKHYIRCGFPSKDKLEEDLCPFWKVRDNLTTHDDIIFMGSRMLVPKTLRPAVLKVLHKSHQGQVRTLRRARQSVFWPGITNDILNVVRSCSECASYLPSQQKEPQYQDPSPTYPFQEVSTDLFSFAGFEYLVMVDRFSGWICISKCGTSATTSIVIKELRKFMTDMGIPAKLVSDNGPQFSSMDFRNWTQEWNIHHSTSSPHFPQSNGHAEAAVKAVKYLLAKASPNGDVNSEAFQEGLMELRNTPRSDGRSPAQILFGAPTRTKLPLHRSRFAAEWKSKSSECDQRAESLREKARARYDANASWLSKLNPGDVVLIQDPKSRHWNLLAEVVESYTRGRSYLVRTESGRLLRRNRRFLRRFTPPVEEEPEQETPPQSKPRRSSRKRRAPTRFANSISLSPRSKLVGGHEISHLVIPHHLQVAKPMDHAIDELEPTNEGLAWELNADISRGNASMITLAITH
ncbi:unnamed protein product [Orchesella dallaii]|uniref:RNA-directed DNA polymerase n=1 Tax=Orchesella dallaii TaxID=48710 RepID=A0ABP1QL58_9HEXA